MPSLASPIRRPLAQMSLRQLLIAVTVSGVVLGIYRIAGARAFVHYTFLLFAVGPWFAHLASECLPVRSQQVRTAAANALLLALFIVTLKLAEHTIEGPILLIVGITALMLWTPQYLLFLVWGDAAEPL